MRLLYSQLRSFCLRFVFFTYGGGTVSTKEQTRFLAGGGPLEVKKSKPIFHGKQNDQAEIQRQVDKTKPIYRKQQRPTVSQKDQTVSQKYLPSKELLRTAQTVTVIHN